MLRLEAREERAVPRVLGAVTVTIDAVECPGGPPCGGVRLGGTRGTRHERLRPDMLGRDAGAWIGMRPAGGRAR
jgi:hypothetical protein